MNRIPLICHPATPCPVDLTLSASISNWLGDGPPQVQLDFEAEGDVQRLKIPAALAPASQSDGLWQHTCFEAFLAETALPGYQEFNFSPSGQWAHYYFASERQRKHPVQSFSAPTIQVTRSVASLQLSARLPVQTFGLSCRWGLTAVIELDDGSLSYWALHHPKAQPDFHDRAGWTVQWSPGAA